MNDQVLLDVESLVVGYGKTEILHGVSLRIAPQELVAVVGPNGAGKSTLAKAVVGLLRPWSGSVRFRGRSIGGIAPEELVRMGIAYLPQLDNVFQTMSVRENLELAGHLQRDRRDGRIKEMYELFPDLERFARAQAQDLSGGQRQMLALARAVMLEPELLLLDEPSAGLSPALADDLFEKVQKLKELGVALLVVEQNVDRVLEIADHAYVLAAGENRFEGSGAGLLADEEIGRLYLGG
ncbi:MAG: ATP-binding cassette domain-containing protein [Acidimicrobiia bacterium]|nr:ATP-binding cassette domain-containing protein [Acidimicrobiia bacterium]